MTCRLIETDPGVSFAAQCNCSGEWRDLERVEGSAEGFPSWNYMHGLGGHTLQCTQCLETYALGGCVEGHGLPDLIPVDELGQIPRLELTRLQRRCLDISLVAEETLWAKSMDLVRAAKLAGDLDAAGGLRTAALLIRGGLQKEKRETLRAILLEHGIDDVPETLRIARTFEGSGYVYDVSRGPLPVRAKVKEPEEVRVPDVVDCTIYNDEIEPAIRRSVW
jgi:hypothetical protein